VYEHGVRLLLATAAGAAVVVMTAVGDARANGRLPTSNKILFAPNDPGYVLLRTTFGVLISHDGGGTWDWLCEAALGIGPTQAVDPNLGVTASGALVAGFLETFLVSSTTTCDWNGAGCPFVGRTIVDITVRPDDPRVVLALTSTSTAVGPTDAGPGCSPSLIDAGIGDSGVGYLNEVWMSADEGAHWSALGTPLSSTTVMTTLEVAASDPHRVYVSGYRPVGDLRDALLFVSLDDGMHWTERPTPPLNQANEAEAYIAAVDPTDAGRVYIRTGGLGPSRLFVTGDAGVTFQIPLTFTRQMLGFALSPDGSKVYAGGPADGVYMAMRSSMSFQRTSTIGVECLATQGPALWACSTEGPNGFIAGASIDDGAMFTAKLHLNGIQAPVSCAPDAAAAQCGGAAFQQLCQSFGCAGRSDGGVSAGDAGAADGSTGGGPDGGNDGGKPPPPAGQPPRSSCGCSVAGGGGAAGLAVAGLLAAGALTAISRRRASPTRGCPSRSRCGPPAWRGRT
jgi:MYXO-CTERM domain-containing protein